MKTPFVVLAVAAALPALAAQPASSDLLLACADIADTAARLECFDRNAATARADRLPDAGPVSPVSAPAPEPTASPPSGSSLTSGAERSDPPAASTSPAAPQSAPRPPGQLARSDFGEEQLGGRAQLPEEEATLQARITETRKATGGLYLVILDNGQVWRHETGSMAEYLRAGEAVTIRRAGLGSYRLTLDAGRNKDWIRVTRIR